jgi:hypothetical protein
MLKTRFLILIFCATLFSAGKIFAQEELVPLSFNPEQAADAARLASQRSAAVAPSDTIKMPLTGFRDMFDYGSRRPDSLLWESDPSIMQTPSGVYINRTWAISPVNLGVCTFDGLKWNGEPYDTLATQGGTGPCDELVSRPLNMSKINNPNDSFLVVGDSVYLSFWYQAGGRGYMPNAQDSILLDFNIPAWNPTPGTYVWKNIWFKEGYNAGGDTTFHLVMIKLDSASYFTPGFRFRFRNYASRCGSNDHWHLDDVYIKNVRTINDTVFKEGHFVYQMPSFITDFQAMPADHYKSTNMISNASVTIRNNDTLPTGRHLDYSYEVYNSLGALEYTSSIVPWDVLPYDSIGYEDHPPMANPPVAANYSFPTFAVGDTGFYTIRHKLKDGTTRTDSADFRQNFYNYYAYDDGTAEVGYGLYGQYSQLAYKFTMPPVTVDSDTLTAIQMYFLPVMDIPNLRQREFTLKVWADGGNQPGTVIYSRLHRHLSYSFETPNRFITYTLDSAIIQLSPGQTYYIGWEQQSLDRLYIGFDFNIDNSDKIYYNTTGNWAPSIFDGSLMMRPVFGKPYPVGGDQTSVEEIAANNFSVYPNPANDMITIAGLKNGMENAMVSLFDISGREVVRTQQINANGTLDVSQLSAGIYFVQLSTKTGESIGTQRVVISR